MDGGPLEVSLQDNILTEINRRLDGEMEEDAKRKKKVFCAQSKTTDH